MSAIPPKADIGQQGGDVRRQAELESQLLAAPAANWREAAEKAGYLLNLFAASLPAQDQIRDGRS